MPFSGIAANDYGCSKNFVESGRPDDSGFAVIDHGTPPSVPHGSVHREYVESRPLYVEAWLSRKLGITRVGNWDDNVQ